MCVRLLACGMLVCVVHVSYQAIDADKVLWALCPGRQLHVRDHSAVLHHAQVVSVGIDKHLREVEELWNQLLHGWSREEYFTSHTGHLLHEQKVTSSTF